MTDPEELTVEFTDATGTRRRVRYRPEPGTERYLRTTMELQDSWRITGEEVVEDLSVETDSRSILWLSSGDDTAPESDYLTALLDRTEGPSTDPGDTDPDADQEIRFNGGGEPLSDGADNTESDLVDVIRPSVGLADFTVADDPDAEVFVSATQDNPTVYHTDRECPQSPERVRTVSRGRATDSGLRECSSCVESRYDFLEP